MTGESHTRADKLARCSAFAVALLLLAATLGTLFEKNLVRIVTPQSSPRELYGTAAALTKLRFGIGGAAIDLRLFAALLRNGLSSAPVPGERVPFPENLRDPDMLQSALDKALTINVAPPRPLSNVDGEYGDFISFTGEDIGIGTYAYLAFETFGVHISSLTYFYFVVVTISLLLYGAGHGRSTGAMAAVVIMILALYVVVCANFMNFTGFGPGYQFYGIDVGDARFLSTLAAIPTLHLLVMWTRQSYRLSRWDYAVLALQSAIFAFALQIRSSAIWAVLALLSYWIVIAALPWRRDHSLHAFWQWPRPRSATTLATFLAVVLSAQVWASLSLSPIYASVGDISHHTFWQGLLSSLQLTPEWDRKYGAAVNGAEGDAMPAQVAWIAIKRLPPDEWPKYVNSDGATKKTALEKFSRIAFFNILRNDPDFVLSTFFVAKPYHILRSEFLFSIGLFSRLPPWNVVLPVPALVFLAWLATRSAEALDVLRSTAAAALLFVLISLLPNWLIALNPLVMVDHFLWLTFLFLACLTIVSATAARWVLGSRQRAIAAS